MMILEIKKGVFFLMADRDVTVGEMTKTGRGAFIQIPN